SAAADALAEAVIFEHGRLLAFVHPLVRSSVYSELSAQERARYHQRAADLLSTAEGTADRVGAHLLSTHPDGNSETVSTLRAPARGAGNRRAPDVALPHPPRALPHPP